MLLGSGIDIIEIERIAAALDRFGDQFCNRIFLRGEIQYCRSKRNSAESFAARFAAKEAAAKALGTGIQSGVGWKDIEIVHTISGKPEIRFHGRAFAIASQIGATGVTVSLTHTRALAMAQVLLEK